MPPTFTHEEVKREVIAILEWYGVSARPEQWTPGGRFRMDVVARSGPGEEDSVNWGIGSNLPDWGIEVEFSSPLQKDLASLWSMSGLDHAVLVTTNNDLLAKHEVKVDGQTIRIFPPPQLATAFEDYVRRVLRKEDAARYPMGRLEVLRTRIELDGEKAVGELESEIRVQSLDLGQCRKMLYETYVGGNVFPAQLVEQAGDLPVRIKTLTKGREPAFLEAVGLLSTWGTWIGTRLTAGTGQSSEKTYYYTLTHRQVGTDTPTGTAKGWGSFGVAHHYADNVVGTKVSEILRVMERYPPAFAHIVPLGTLGEFELWQGEYDEWASPASLGRIGDGQGWIASRGRRDEILYALDINPQDWALLSTLAHYRGIRLEVQAYFEELVKIGVAVNGGHITTTKHEWLPHIALPIEFFRGSTLGNWRKYHDVSRLKRFVALALVGFRFPGQPPRGDFELALRDSGLAIEDVLPVVVEMSAKGLTSRPISRGDSVYVVYDVEGLRAETKSQMDRLAKDILGLPKP